MTLAELIAARQRGEAIPAEMVAPIAAILQLWKPPKRGRPRRPYETELREKMALIERVETLTASFGSRQQAFEKLASERHVKATSVERYYRLAKKLQKLLKQWEDALNENTRALKECTKVIENAWIKNHSDENCHQ